MAGYDNNKLGELRPNQIITTFGQVRLLMLSRIR